MYLNALGNQVIPDAETLSLNYLPDRARSFIVPPTRVTNQSQIEANKSNQSPTKAQNTDLPAMVEPTEAQTKPNNQSWLINYKEFYQK